MPFAALSRPDYAEIVASPLTFRVLGAVEVHRDGLAVHLPSSRQRAVLAALLVHAGRPVRGDALVAAAWDDALPANPRAALHTVLSRLRAALGPGSITSEPAGYRLAVEPEAVDAARFEMLHRRAREAPAESARGMLERGLRLWRGPAYAEVADSDFAAAEAVRLDELRATCIEDLAEARIEVGDVATAVAALEAFVEQEPLRERARGLLMTALYHAGRVSEALDSYHGYRRLLVDELGLEPSPALRELQQRILNHSVDTGSALRPAPRTPVVAPWPVTEGTFLGRDDEAATLVELATGHRLVTITGVGGVGKTRLVAEALTALAGKLALPATVVELASVDDNRVDTAVAAALEIGSAWGGAREAVLDYLSVVPALIVLDNCEHVLGNVQPLVQAVLRRCPDVRVVATSRQRIGLAAEQVLPLDPLPTPAAGAAGAELTAAVRLFTDRARRVRPAFALAGGAVPAVAEICRRLDGLPLAIELAATRAATLGVEPLLERLDDSLDLLGDADAGGEQSLRATIDWSYSLLDEDDRLLFAALATFEGDVDLDGAEHAVAGLVGRPAAVGLARLVEASLVAAHEAGGRVRYRLLEIVRAFARERLAESGVERDVRLAHARWVRSVIRAAAAAAVGPGDTVSAVLRADTAAGIRAAAVWALREEEAQLAGEITGTLMLATVHWQLRRDLLDIVRQVADDPVVGRTPAAALARAAGAFAAIWQGDLEIGERAARAALETAREPDERFLALCALGVGTIYSGEHDASRRWWRELLAVEGLAVTRHVDGHASLALIACYEGKIPEAREHADRATAVAEAVGSTSYRAFARYADAKVTAAADYAAGVPLLVAATRDAERAGAEFAGGLAAGALAAALTRLGRTAEARDVLGPLLKLWLRLAAWPQLWTTLRILAEWLARNDRCEEAALLLAAADQAPSAPAIAGTDTERYARLGEMLRERLGPETHQKIATLAAVLPRTHLVDRARAELSGRGAGEPPDSAVGGRPEGGGPGRIIK